MFALQCKLSRDFLKLLKYHFLGNGCSGTRECCLQMEARKILREDEQIHASRERRKMSVDTETENATIMLIFCSTRLQLNREIMGVVAHCCAARKSHLSLCSIFAMRSEKEMWKMWRGNCEETWSIWTWEMFSPRFVQPSEEVTIEWIIKIEIEGFVKGNENVCRKTTCTLGTCEKKLRLCTHVMRQILTASQCLLLLCCCCFLCLALWTAKQIFHLQMTFFMRSVLLFVGAVCAWTFHLNLSLFARVTYTQETVEVTSTVMTVKTSWFLTNDPQCRELKVVQTTH